MMPDTAAHLARALGAAGHESVGVEVTGKASTGATRQTLFIEVTREATVEPMVATLNNPAMATLTVDDEWWCLEAAARAGMPIAEPVARGDLGDEAGSTYLITRHVEGETVPRRVLRAVEAGATSAALTEQLAGALARLHQQDVTGSPLPRFDSGAQYLESLRDILERLPQKSPVLALGYRWLVDHPVPQAQTTLVHGDYRLGNFIVDDGRLAAVLDWELAHIGDPMEDVAWLCLRSWRFGNDDSLVGGFGDLDEFALHYQSAGGSWRPAALHWWLVARTLWWGVMLALQASVFVAGLTDAIVLAASGRRVAEQEHDLLQLIGLAP